jgi:hypothetical protein
MGTIRGREKKGKEGRRRDKTVKVSVPHEEPTPVKGSLLSCIRKPLLSPPHPPAYLSS